MITGIEAGRLLCLKAAWNKDNNLSYDIESAMAKVFCSELSMKVASEAIHARKIDPKSKNLKGKIFLTARFSYFCSNTIC